MNMCETILEARPAGELVQPTEEELAAMPTATATAVPADMPTPAPTSTPRPVEGEDATEILLNSGCGSCHKIGELGEGHKVGPDLSNINHRVPE
jgi:cytochrome c2